ncbi:MAG: hypothetical protein ACKV2T_00780 [Kofleriaceae bacterium]
MTDRYPYDPGAFARVWKQLWALVPSYYRVLDGGEHLDTETVGRELAAGTLAGPHDLRRLLGALAAPLAAVRQSVEELHRDLFIDSAGDGAIALLADMVGTTLVFPDARSNRRDVRGTVGWRRRKGTPAMLEDLVDDLSGRMTPLLEGWKLLAITQDLDLLRMPRTTIDLRDIRVAERTRGPLDATYHVVDIRTPSARTGRYHPAHLSHWMHVTQLFPLVRGEAAYIGDQGDPIAGTVNPPAAPPLDREWRYTMHPLGRTYPLRARRVAEGDDLRSDRIPAMHFAHDPGEYFAREGRFAVEILGLPAAVGATGELADPLRTLASTDLLAGPHTFELLERPRRSDDATVISLFAVGLAGSPPIASGAQTEIAQATLATGTLGSTTTINPAPGGSPAVMIRLAPASGASAFFAGGTFALTAGSPARWRAPTPGSTIDAGELARRGQLRGAVVFTLPPAWITNERWFYLGADGTLGEAQTDGLGPITIALDPDGRIELSNVASGGVGSAWPPHSLAAEREPTQALLPAPGTGPVRMHGGPLLDPAAPAPHLPARIVFAIATTTTTTTFAPIGALIVGSPVVADRGRWDILDDVGAAVGSPAAALARLRALAVTVANAGEGTQELMFRLECATAGAVLPPCEIVWPAASGGALLVHVAELVADQVAHTSWPSTDSVSRAFGIGRDGSTWIGQFVARYSHGGIAPLGPADSGSVLHRRRRARWRLLCPWRNEIPASGDRLDPTPSGVLDIDVEHGLFALALGEPAPVAPGRVPNVTVSYQQGASAHIGAQPAERSTLLRHLPEVATRIVSRSGVAGTGALATTLATPRYTTLTAALAAIHSDTSRAPTEVVEIADSSIYAAEAPAWPGVGGLGGAPTRTLIIRAAENARPVIRLAGWTSATGAGFERVVFRGLTLAAAGPLVLAPPLVAPSVDPGLRHATFSFSLSTIATEGLALHASEPTSGAHLVVDRAITGPLSLISAGQIFATRSITDAIVTDRGTTNIDRTTIFGTLDTNILEASESIFVGLVTVLDRFHGCIRFSRVETGSVLPARHRVVEGVTVRFTSIDRNDAAYARLAESCDARIQFGAADGAEKGAFHDELWSVRREAVARRLTEYTPAGLVSGLIRMD